MEGKGEVTEIGGRKKEWGTKWHRERSQIWDDSGDGWHKWWRQLEWVKKQNNSGDEDFLHLTSALYVPLLSFLVCFSQLD